MSYNSLLQSEVVVQVNAPRSKSKKEFLVTVFERRQRQSRGGARDAARVRLREERTDPHEGRDAEQECGKVAQDRGVRRRVDGAVPRLAVVANRNPGAVDLGAEHGAEGGGGGVVAERVEDLEHVTGGGGAEAATSPGVRVGVR